MSPDQSNTSWDV